VTSLPNAHCHGIVHLPQQAASYSSRGSYLPPAWLGNVPSKPCDAGGRRHPLQRHTRRTAVKHHAGQASANIRHVQVLQVSCKSDSIWANHHQGQAIRRQLRPCPNQVHLGHEDTGSLFISMLVPAVQNADRQQSSRLRGGLRMKTP
jgi:hypothetical protein